MHNQLEKYLWQIEKQLAALPAEQRQEELREIRSHLEMMIDGFIVRGFDADEAVIKALEQFGAADKVGKALECTHESSPEQKAKTKIRMWAIVALIYSTNIIAIWLTWSGTISGSHDLTSGYTYFTVVLATFVGGWINESMDHKKLDLLFIKRFPAFCLLMIVLMIVLQIKSFLFLPFLIFPSIAAGARAYRWYADYQRHSDWRQT